MLGIDPSKQKLMNTLGVDENTLGEILRLIRHVYTTFGKGSAEDLNFGVHTLLSAEEVRMETVLREEDVYRRKRKNSASMDKKHALKALDMLGVDPSKDKVRHSFGAVHMYM